MPANLHKAPRILLLDHLFWDLLPANHDKIKQCWAEIARSYDEANLDLLSSDRAAAVESLKAELELLEKDIEEYRSTVKKIDIMDLAEMYLIAGTARQRALQNAKEDLENVE